MGIFTLDLDYRNQLLQHEQLIKSNPNNAEQLNENGKLLIQVAKQGQLHILRKIIEEGEQPWHLMTYYIIQMFRQACFERHIDILHFMCELGIELEHTALQSILHDLIIEIKKSKREESEYQPVIHFLLRNGVNINYQRPKEYQTALHLACRSSLYSIVYLLLLYDADINAVANNDTTPMKCAQIRLEELKNMESPIAHDNELENQLRIIKLLDENNAKLTWRTKQNNVE